MKNIHTEVYKYDVPSGFSNYYIESFVDVHKDGYVPISAGFSVSSVGYPMHMFYLQNEIVRFGLWNPNFNAFPQISIQIVVDYIKEL